MKVVIAGCGYVGKALAAELVTAGHAVVGLKRTPTGLPDGALPLAADLFDASALATALAPHRDADAVVYAASPGVRDRSKAREAYRRTYREGPANVLRALSPRRFVLVSSTGVYGASDGRWVDEDTPPEPTRATGEELLAGEEALHAARPDAVVLRLSGIYGPTRTMLVRGVRDGRARRPRETKWTNRIHRDDCAGALHHLLELAQPAPLYCGTDDTPARLADVQAFVAERLGVPVPGPGDGVEAPGRGGSKRIRNARLRASGYTFRVPSYREGYPAIVDAVMAEAEP
ncbi:MAG: SDR family oxidoreductase [Myxococcota bacterium]